MRLRTFLLALLLGEISLASWWTLQAGDSRAPAYAAEDPFKVSEVARFDEPWAMAIDPGTGVIFVTERGGRIKFVSPGGKIGTVTGVPQVAYGGQGGLGDIVFAPAPPRAHLDRRTVYLSWAEAGGNDTRGAAVARGELLCEEHDSCALTGLTTIWRQTPKTTGRGHYSHRIAFSPDGRHLFVASGERQKMAPAQDMAGNLGKIVRLLPDGSPAPGNPFAAQGGVAVQVWTLGHRNVLGLAFDPQGRLWGLEHGPRGGDELNLIAPGKNYGWPLVSEGRHYDGRHIPPHSTRPDLAAPAISWDPVIAPGNFIFCRCAQFPAWRGQVLIAALGAQGIVRVATEGTKAREVARYDLGERIRAIAEAGDGALYVLEDGDGGRLLRLSPR